jgi:hypothetical protein
MNRMPLPGTLVRSTLTLGLLLAAACATPADPDPSAGVEQDLPRDASPSAASGPDSSFAPSLAGVAYAELRAWEDTRRGLPPLRVMRPDSVASVVAWMDARRGGWTRVATLPGIALPVEFWRDGALVARVGVINTAHGEGGYLVTWDPANAARAATRPINAREFDTVMAFFGMSTVIAP